MKLLAIGASTSSRSINRQFATYVANLVKDATITSLDLSKYELPIYSEDEEASNGIPAAAPDFLSEIQNHDAIILSLAEHNGSYTAAFKNLYDWASRVEYSVWSNKPMILLATSPGGRGGQTVLETAKQTFPRMGAEIIGSFSLGNFHDNFKNGKLIDQENIETLTSIASKLIPE